MIDPAEFVERVASARIGATFNFYRDGDRAQELRARLTAYLARHVQAPLLLVGEAPGYRGARISGVPLTSERQLTGTGPAEATATVVHTVLRELALTDAVLLWNAVPTHPGSARANRPPSRTEVAAGAAFARELAAGRRVICLGRVAHGALTGTYVRHPARGGARAFAEGLAAAVAQRGWEC